MNLLSLTLVCLLVGVAVAYPTGPPESACTSMFPSGHHADNSTTPYEAMNSTSPYRISVTSTKYCAASTIQVTIEPIDQEDYYEGVFLQARCSGTAGSNCTNDQAIGTFVITTAADMNLFKLMNCHGTNNSALSHKTDAEKKKKTFTWIPPQGFKDPVKFRATFVEEEDEFWTGVMSSEVSFTAVSAECTISAAMTSSVVSATLILLALVAALH